MGTILVWCLPRRKEKWHPSSEDQDDTEIQFSEFQRFLSQINHSVILQCPLLNSCPGVLAGCRIRRGTLFSFTEKLLEDILPLAPFCTRIYLRTSLLP